MATNLLDWIVDLMRDGGAREAFSSSPQLSMVSAGFTSTCGSGSSSAPAIREVAGVDFPAVQGVSTPQQVEYVINNYTIEAPTSNGGNVIDQPDIDGPDIDNTGDGNTNTADEANTTTQTSTDSSTDVDQEADNVVAGDGSAGDDQIQGSTITDVDEGITGDDNTNVLVLTDNLNDLDVLSNLVDDTLNGSPILNNSPILNDVVHDSLGNVHDLVNILG